MIVKVSGMSFQIYDIYEMLKIALLHPITINGDLGFQASESGIKWFI